MNINLGPIPYTYLTFFYACHVNTTVKMCMILNLYIQLLSPQGPGLFAKRKDRGGGLIISARSG